jgi:hypothetical protein
MRYKEQTIRKIEGQIQKLTSVQRGIEGKMISADDTLSILRSVIKDLQIVNDRLQLEHDE